MGIKDLHEKPFDQGTITKLEIFEDYTQAWLPTFVMSGFGTVCIIDFFAGKGYDINGIEGSPIRILKKILDHTDIILQKRTKIYLKLNEFKKPKFIELQNACSSFIEEQPILKLFVEIEYSNLEFEKAFEKYYSDIIKHPSLVFLDQNGVKFLKLDTINKLEKSKRTDFLFFVSTSYFKRFDETPEFKQSIDFDIEDLKKNPYQFIHRNLIGAIKNKLPSNSNLQLYPFSIKKRSGIYGLVFGASHQLAVNKFLEIVWKKSGLNGEANFDIEDDLSKAQLGIFDQPKLTKIQSFQRDLRDNILSKKITDNKSVIDYTLSKGHIGSHAREEIIRMKKENLIDYEGNNPLISYDSAIKNQKLVIFSVKK
ncbi:three-Cys-motif partner protein [Aquiflexum balticum DSM 16537]|uniref:Three-Cys-motif partner protein n=1 Tax=Aquiflexum balticum DSM 16537 TaxID=758820 RepID=A0A1W2H7S1_9BACT|nr:three-Cys-motif partner protein TcmP [Aquiflexum balticum]SMD44814.1 three-Cys-motif partner protein [Aquiflexum balticum DSM 16537]